jgi:hypothetical protein
MMKRCYCARCSLARGTLCKGKVDARWQRRSLATRRWPRLVETGFRRSAPMVASSAASPWPLRPARQAQLSILGALCIGQGGWRLHFGAAPRYFEARAWQYFPVRSTYWECCGHCLHLRRGQCPAMKGRRPVSLHRSLLPSHPHRLLCWAGPLPRAYRRTPRWPRGRRGAGGIQLHRGDARNGRGRREAAARGAAVRPGLMAAVGVIAQNQKREGG